MFATDDPPDDAIWARLMAASWQRLHDVTFVVEAECRAGALSHGGTAVSAIKVRLRESPLAWAAFDGSVA